MSDIHSILKQYWGYDAFRPAQEEIIQAVIQKKDTLALLPTGGGKSLCFQVPALAQEGVCVVISPLIALMKDQVTHLHKRQIAAVAVYSGMTKREVDMALEQAAQGKVKFLYVSPERVQTTLFRERFKRMQVNCLAVDEAHCISQWGYDFRPPYLQIAELRALHPKVPVLALTASATPQVCNDIMERLQFRAPHMVKGSFQRPNLGLIVREQENKDDKLLEILRNVQGSAVIYVRNRRRTKEVAEFLVRHHIAASFYHAGLDPEVRNHRQDQWVQDRVRVMVCTNAFGMGIDKPDVRVVVHLDLPDAPEAYYQEAGRAGRDGKRSFAGLLFDAADVRMLMENTEKQHPEPAFVRTVYHHLCNYCQVAIGAGKDESFDFDIATLCQRFSLPALETRNALRVLEQQGFVYLSEAYYKPSTIHIPVDKETLYRFQVEHKSMEPVIKIILRTATGVFDEPVAVKESALAYHASMPEDKLVEILHYLHKMAIITYAPMRRKPQVTFLQPRAAAEDLPLDFALMQMLRERAMQRAEAMQAYVNNHLRCRSQVLLEYFGETTEPCGVCDICVEKHRMGISDTEFRRIFDWIKERLASGDMTPESLLHDTLPARSEKILEVLHFLTDTRQVLHTNDNILIWKA